MARDLIILSIKRYLTRENILFHVSPKYPSAPIPQQIIKNNNYIDRGDKRCVQPINLMYQRINVHSRNAGCVQLHNKCMLHDNACIEN